MLSWILLDYDLKKYPFSVILERHLGCPLELVHETWPLTDKLALGTEQQTPVHQKLYSVGAEFARLYSEFVVDVVRKAVGEEFVYQRKPNFRIHCPRNVSVRGFHRDRDDNHLSSEINFWVPLTRVCRSNALWLESNEGACDLHPVMAQPGQIIVFDGANLLHGSQVNCEPYTRVSFDFRVVARRLFRPSSAVTVYQGSTFRVGDYFADSTDATSHADTSR